MWVPAALFMIGGEAVEPRTFTQISHMFQGRKDSEAGFSKSCPRSVTEFLARIP
jgi:hypothetical protein